MLNSGLLAINPSQAVYDKIIAQLATPATSQYTFPDQDLLADIFAGHWVALPYVYNALKTLRWEGVHDAIWRDDRVKNVHYILSPKPWDNLEDKESQDPTFAWWREVNEERVRDEQKKGLH